ncbi:MAG: sel1 repeat family protein [Hyphomicrobium sp.]
MARFEVSSDRMGNYSAFSGSSDPLFELGLMHSIGKDAPVNLIEAHKWFNLAALRGNSEAKSYRLEIATEMSKREIAEAQRLAREWLAQN